MDMNHTVSHPMTRERPLF